MVGDSSNSAKKVSLRRTVLVIAKLINQALTIAVRYAAVRRQFSSGKNKVSQLIPSWG